MGAREPHFYTQAGPVTVRQADGTTELVPALDEQTYQEVVKVRWAIPLGVRQKILRRDGHACRYCGVSASDIDHVVPVALGGSNRMGNLVISCTDCNSRKGARVWRPKPLHSKTP